MWQVLKLQKQIPVALGSVCLDISQRRRLYLQGRLFKCRLLQGLWYNTSSHVLKLFHTHAQKHTLTLYNENETIESTHTKQKDNSMAQNGAQLFPARVQWPYLKLAQWIAFSQPCLFPASYFFTLVFSFSTALIHPFTLLSLIFLYLPQTNLEHNAQGAV